MWKATFRPGRVPTGRTLYIAAHASGVVSYTYGRVMVLLHPDGTASTFHLSGVETTNRAVWTAQEAA